MTGSGFVRSIVIDGQNAQTSLLCQISGYNIIGSTVEVEHPCASGGYRADEGSPW